MFPRILTRLPAAARAVRYNSSSSSSPAARVIEMAARAERPTTAEISVPLLWAATAGLAFTAWNRMDERGAAGNVEKLLVV
ncbi:hypothetical protein P153DRAFT_368764 [Dothidotthia symphoricarpi CBS 119687]|uniref:Uncharacterized protein n=1 Tax=Dothidotthia symphoricarpi CBS 119687 TaxID=1392245 RepID=A0A6A6A687_9PLEO|nr:uncharacterized protein P153DRAFT_368764 [Dothidotthia symphoricarpi CBS 119687]KAF2126695.1 hypothetical protein P153DRAFT_368764 [Dothidotthia symphoricarpi CBS 119687]